MSVNRLLALALERLVAFINSNLLFTTSTAVLVTLKAVLTILKLKPNLTTLLSALSVWTGRQIIRSLSATAFVGRLEVKKKAIVLLV